MTSIILTIHILAAIALIGVVLIQRGQGADIGASFGGGGAQTLFGSRGSGSFLGKVTGGLAATFMLTSLTLAFFTQQDAGSLVERAAPVQQPTLPASDGGVPSAAGFDPSALKKEGKDSSSSKNGKSESSASIEIPVSKTTESSLPSADADATGHASASTLPGAEGEAGK